MPIEKFSTDKAPPPVGPYSQVVKAGDLVFTAGQIPVNPVTGEIVTEIGEATEQTIKNIQAVLEAAGASLDQVIAVTVYMADLSDFDAMNKVYDTFFGGTKPVRAALQAAALPKGVCLEMQATAYVGA